MGDIHLEKQGLRGLAIAESFRQGDVKSKLAGIVMRRDFVIDGFVFDLCTVEGDDATDSVLNMYSKLGRGDIRFILISGLIIAMYNIIDIARIRKEIGLPVIGVTYEKSNGIKDAIKSHFPNSYESKIKQYDNLGKRCAIRLHTGHVVYVRTEGCTSKEAHVLLDHYTIHGSIPEPLRVAHLLAKSI